MKRSGEFKLGSAFNFLEVLDFLSRHDLDNEVVLLSPETTPSLVCALSELLEGLELRIETYVNGEEGGVHDPVEIANIKHDGGLVVFDAINKIGGGRNFSIAESNKGKIRFELVGLRMEQVNAAGRSVVWQINKSE